MALSDWDTLAIDQDGPCQGVLEGHSGHSSVEIYKNWLYVSDERMFKKDLRYTGNVIAEIQEGNVSLSDFNIRAKRGRQNSILVFAESQSYGEADQVHRWMAGIGCCGYDDPTERLAEAMGVDLSKYAYVSHYSGSNAGEDGWHYGLSCFVVDPFALGPNKQSTLEEFTIPSEGNEHLDSQFVGVQEETFQELLAFLDELKGNFCGDIPEWIDKVTAGGFDRIRFNQGDAFFADNGVVALPASEIDNQQEPVIMQMIRQVERRT